MTKEEILSRKPQYSRLSFGLAGGDENEYTTIRGAQEAMDEYAKQQAIAFMNWTFTEGCQYTATDYDQWTEAGNHLDNITTEDLYQIFEQQNKQQ